MMGLLCVLLLQAGSGPLEAGLAASREGRYEEAARLLQRAVADSPQSYEGLVALGLAWGRLGRQAEARLALDRAVYLQPRRPEALVERGGLRFLAADYEGAARDLRAALATRPDPYTREMLASSLHLDGHPHAALRQWNRLGQPLVQDVAIEGLKHTKERFVRRELMVSEGRLLRPRHLHGSELRLKESGLFREATVRSVPLGSGKANLEVAVIERHGLFAHWLEFVAMTAVHAASQKVRLRYDNLLDSGVSLATEYKWEKTQPRVVGTLDWVRPVGLPFNLRLEGLWARPQYELDGPLTMRTRGGDVALRRVVGARTVVELRLKTRRRTFSRPRFDAPDGTLTGVEVGLERQWVLAYRHRLDSMLRFFQASEVLDSDFIYPRGLALLRYSGTLAGADGSAMPGSVFATQLHWGVGGTGMPLDEMFAPGAAAEMEFPLRGHRQKRSGILGQTPIGRNLALVNVEWRQRVLNLKSVQAGFVVFYDGAWVDDRAQGPGESVLHDVGAGLRLRLPRASTLRLDYGYSLTGDGKTALTAGLGHAF